MVKSTSKRVMITLSKEDLHNKDKLLVAYDCTLSQLISHLLSKEIIKKGLD